MEVVLCAKNKKSPSISEGDYRDMALPCPIAVSLRKEMLGSRQILRKNQEQTSHETYYSKSDAKGIG